MIGRTITLLELITFCSGKRKDYPVVFDNKEFPTTIDSWRGIYSELALSHECDGTPMTCGAFVQMLKGCYGKVFHGYKGGEFTMNDSTEVWVDNVGEYTRTIISSVEILNEQIIINIEIEED